MSGKLWIVALALGLGACAGEDESGATGMANEVNGECVFKPGSYVATYDVLDASASCEDMEPLPDEYMTITDGRAFAGRSSTPEGCVDGDFIVEGCFVGFERSCAHTTSSGRLTVDVVFEFDYEKGTGIVDMHSSLYSGSILIDTCLATQSATIRPR
jgi:hypothetical protein